MMGSTKNGRKQAGELRGRLPSDGPDMEIGHMVPRDAATETRG